LHILLASRIGKWTHAIGAASGLRRDARPSVGYLAGGWAVDIDDFDMPAAVAGEAGPVEMLRRTSIIRARKSWIGGRALPSRESHAGNDRRDKRGSAG
jgi:hypothetical protein